MSKAAKLFTVLLVAAVVVASVFSFSGQASNIRNKVDFTMAVVSDIHVLLEEQVGPRSEEFLKFDSDKCGKIFHLSHAIFKTAVDILLEKKPDVLLISGDLCDVGNVSGHEAIVKQLRRLTSGGIAVYMIAGNHDTRLGATTSSYETGVRTNIPAAQYFDIPTYYAEFGYNQALYRDTESNSYVADINDEFRLIAIDPDLAIGNDSLTDKLIAWSKAQTEKAVEDGKTPIGMIHEPILFHFGPFIETLAVDDTTVYRPNEYRDALLDAGMHYVFTGHLHSQDVMTYENEDGEILYDIETGSLANFPMPIRIVEQVNGKLYFSVINVDHIPEEYLPDYLYDYELTAIKKDFMDFAERFMLVDAADLLYNVILPEMLPTIFGLFGLNENSPEVTKLTSDFIAMTIETLSMPLYKKGATGASLESVCNKYGITDIPETRYESISDMMIRGMLGPNYYGDENVYLGSDVEKLFRLSVYAVLNAVADFDLFGRLHEIDENIPNVPLKPYMEQLFKEGKLELVDNELLSGVISSIPFIRDNDTLKNFVGAPSQDILNAVVALFGKVPFFGIEIGPYLDKTEGVFLIKKFYDEILYGVVAEGLLIDFGPPDNELIIDMKTLEWKPLK